MILPRLGGNIFIQNPRYAMNFKLSTDPAAVRGYVQVLFVLFFIFVGWEFYHYFLWATGQSAEFTARPPAAEAFLPISALVAAKNFILGGGWDPVHPAGLVIFFLAIAMALLARKGFCGYFCPVGWITGRLEKLGRKLRITRRPGRVFNWILSVPKYVLLGFFVWLIIIRMSPPEIHGFLRSPYNMVADSKMLAFFLNPSATTLIALAVIALGSMIIPGFWCRGLCPYGALMGLLSWLSPVAVRRDRQSCVHCGKCGKACPVRIPVQTLERVSSPECQGCLECVSACPVENCLEVKIGYGGSGKTVPDLSLPLLCVALLAVFYFAALLSGHWYSEVPPQMLPFFHEQMNILGN